MYGMKPFRSGIWLIIIGIIASCSEDESPPDFVGESVGTYSYSTNVNRANKATPDNLVGTLSISRNGDDITIIVDDIEPFKSSRLALTSNGYAFNIEDVTLTDSDGDLVNRTGETSTWIKATPYNGRFDAGTKQLFMKMSYTYQDPKYSQYNFKASVMATKK